MSFIFGKKKNDSSQEPQDEKRGGRLDKFQDELTVLHKDEMSKVEGGKSSNKSLSDLSDLSNSFGGTIPL
jgi:hypothetical protein